MLLVLSVLNEFRFHHKNPESFIVYSRFHCISLGNFVGVLLHSLLPFFVLPSPFLLFPPSQAPPFFLLSPHKKTWCDGSCNPLIVFCRQ